MELTKQKCECCNDHFHILTLDTQAFLRNCDPDNLEIELSDDELSSLYLTLKEEVCHPK